MVTCNMKSMGHSNHSWPSTPAVSPHTTSILLAYNSKKMRIKTIYLFPINMFGES
jgi:hypothetical protein